MLLLLVGLPQEARAQRHRSWSWQTEPTFGTYERQEIEPPSAADALWSLAVPGLGQHRQGRATKWIFLAVEVAAWSVYLERRADGGDLRDDYRDFAWEHARLQAGARVDGDFEYYETLSKWEQSGAFDRDTDATGIQPQEGSETYNGMIWARAQGIFLGGGGQPGDPGFAQALEYYQQRAYGAGFLWNWSPDPDGRAQLGELISESDSRFRQATTAMGIVIANHVAAAVEAFVEARAIKTPASIDFAPRRGARGLGWSATLRVPVGR